MESQKPEPERTFLMIKPDGVQKGLIGKTIRRFEERGYKLVAMQIMKPSEDLLKLHYYEHRNKPFFKALVDRMKDKPVVAMVWEGLNVVAIARKMMGVTNPLNSDPGTIRGDFSITTERNHIHGSDSITSATREVELWFPELIPPKKSFFDDEDVDDFKTFHAEQATFKHPDKDAGKAKEFELPKNLPKSYKKRRYYTPADVAAHNKSNDLWVSLFHKVYDLTPLIQENFHSKLIDPLVDVAGTDITHWFDAKTRDPQMKIDVNTGSVAYYLPRGRYLHIPEDGTQDIIDTPWWRDEKYIIGSLSKKVRKIKVVNALTSDKDILEVPSEETIEEIRDRYLVINAHAASYTWKRLTKPLDMQKTLEENEIPDETDYFDSLDIPKDEWYIPAVQIYYNDDLTIA